MKNTSLTKEQVDIVENTHGDTIIKAFAGTGKTTTLIELALARPETKFLYLAFNKAISEEASKKFPSNVKCQTLNSLAYQYEATKFMTLNDSGLSSKQVNALTNNWRKTRIIIKTIKNFQLSADPEICDKNVDHTGLRRFLLGYIQQKINDELKNEKDAARQTQIEESRELRKEEFVKNNYQAFVEKCIKKSDHIWKIIIDENDPRIDISHDTYVKLFSLNVNCDAFASFDYVLFDEAQDSNDVVFNALKNSGKPVVAVGDAHQAIYGFRGSINALDKFDGQPFVLSESFRFGHEIAQLANRLLERMCGEKVKISGNKNVKSSISPNYKFSLSADGDKLIISRTNSKLLMNALFSLEKNAKYHVIGGIKEGFFSMIESVLAYSQNRPRAIKDEDVLYIYENNKQPGTLEKFANDNNKTELLTAISVVKKFGPDTRRVIDKIIANDSGMEESDVWLATAHKSKGLEADIVLLANDFKTFSVVEEYRGKKFSLCERAAQEVNLLYVALTRCKKHLFINDCVEQFNSEDRKFHKNRNERDER